MHRGDPRVAGFLCALIVFFPIFLWIGALILQVAVRITNALLGGAAPSRVDFYDASGYPVYTDCRPRTGQPLAVPELRRGMVIMFAVWIASIFARRFALLVVAACLKAGPTAIAQGKWETLLDINTRGLIATIVGVIVHVLLIAVLLPTSLGRACLVAVVECGFVFAVFFVLTLAIFAAKVPGIVPF
jgi:hypothetical protein